MWTLTTVALVAALLLLGSTLTLDGHPIINDGYNTNVDAFAQKSGVTFLEAGFHDLTVDTYGFQASGVGVDLSWTPPSGSSALVPAANLVNY